MFCVKMFINFKTCISNATKKARIFFKANSVSRRRGHQTEADMVGVGGSSVAVIHCCKWGLPVESALCVTDILHTHS